VYILIKCAGLLRLTIIPEFILSFGVVKELGGVYGPDEAVNVLIFGPMEPR
jgi:hypothetical protein